MNDITNLIVFSDEEGARGSGPQDAYDSRLVSFSESALFERNFHDSKFFTYDSDLSEFYRPELIFYRDQFGGGGTASTGGTSPAPAPAPAPAPTPPADDNPNFPNSFDSITYEMDTAIGSNGLDIQNASEVLDLAEVIGQVLDLETDDALELVNALIETGNFTQGMTGEDMYYVLNGPRYGLLGHNQKYDDFISQWQPHDSKESQIEELNQRIETWDGHSIAGPTNEGEPHVWHKGLALAQSLSLMMAADPFEVRSMILDLHTSGHLTEDATGEDIFELFDFNNDSIIDSSDLAYYNQYGTGLESWQDILTLTQDDSYASDSTFAFIVASRPIPGDSASVEDQQAYDQAILNLKNADNDLVFDDQNKLDLSMIDSSVFINIAQQANELGLDTVEFRANYLLSHQNDFDFSDLDDDVINETVTNTLRAYDLDEDTVAAAALSIGVHLENDVLHPREALLLADRLSDITGVDGFELMTDIVNNLYDLTQTPEHGRHLAFVLEAAPAATDAGVVSGPAGEVPVLSEWEAQILADSEIAKAQAEAEASGEFAEWGEQATQAARQIVAETFAESEAEGAVFLEATAEATTLAEAAEAAIALVGPLGPVAFGAIAVAAIGYGIFKGIQALETSHDASAVKPFAESFSEDLSRAADIIKQASTNDRLPTIEEVQELNEIMGRLRSDSTALQQALNDHPHAPEYLKSLGESANSLVDELYEQALQGPLGLNLAPIDGGNSVAQQITHNLQENILNDLGPAHELINSGSSFSLELTQGNNHAYGTQVVVHVAAGTTLTPEMITDLKSQIATAVAGSTAISDLNGLSIEPELIIKTTDGPILYDSHVDLNQEQQFLLQQLFDNNSLDATITRDANDQIIVSVKDRAGNAISEVLQQALTANIAGKLGHHNFTLNAVNDPNQTLPPRSQALYSFNSDGILLGGADPNAGLISAADVANLPGIALLPSYALPGGYIVAPAQVIENASIDPVTGLVQDLNTVVVNVTDGTTTGLVNEGYRRIVPLESVHAENQDLFVSLDEQGNIITDFLVQYDQQNGVWEAIQVPGVLQGRLDIYTNNESGIIYQEGNVTESDLVNAYLEAVSEANDGVVGNHHFALLPPVFIGVDNLYGNLTPSPTALEDLRSHLSNYDASATNQSGLVEDILRETHQLSAQDQMSLTADERIEILKAAFKYNLSMSSETLAILGTAPVSADPAMKVVGGPENVSEFLEDKALDITLRYEDELLSQLLQPNLTQDQIKDILRQALQIASEEYGLTNEVNLTFSPDGNNLYDPSDNTITLNAHLLLDLQNPEQIPDALDTVAHEALHAYQHQLQADLVTGSLTEGTPEYDLAILASASSSLLNQQPGLFTDANGVSTDYYYRSWHENQAYFVGNRIQEALNTNLRNHSDYTGREPHLHTDSDNGRVSNIYLDLDPSASPT